MNSNAPEIVVSSPADCTVDERSAFVDLAAKGDEVERADIEAGVNHSALLLRILGKDSLAAVGAVKNPNAGYRNGVFKKAGVAADAREYLVEFGYLFVDRRYRRNGYGPSIVRCAIRAANRRMFATVRVDNYRMKEILTEAGFSPLGVAYPSARNPRRMLQLFVLAPKKD